MCLQVTTVSNTYIVKDDVVLSQMNKATSGTRFVFAPRDDDLALGVLESTISHDDRVPHVSGLYKLDIVGVEVVHLQESEPGQATIERRRNESRSSDKAALLIFRLTEETPKAKGRSYPAPTFPRYRGPERHLLRCSKDIFDEYDNRCPNGLVRVFVIRDRIDDHDFRRIGCEEGYHALQVRRLRSVMGP